METFNSKASVLIMVAVIVSLAGCSSVGTTMPVTPGHELQPLNVGWQRYFDIDWQQGERHGTPILSGRVENKYGEAATHVQLLVDGLDAKGKTVTQKVTGWATTFQRPTARTSRSRWRRRRTTA